VRREACSSAPASLNKMPRRAPMPVPTIIAVGVAEPERVGARDDHNGDREQQRGLEREPNTQNHAANVISPPASATSTSQNAALSASRCAGAFEFCAACTSATICASAVFEPTFVARARRNPPC